MIEITCKKDIEKYGIMEYEVLAEYVPYEMYYAFNAKYFMSMINTHPISTMVCKKSSCFFEIYDIINDDIRIGEGHEEVHIHNSRTPPVLFSS